MFVHEVCILKYKTNKEIQTNKETQKYFHPSSLNQLIYAHVHCALSRAKKGQQKVPTLKKTTGLCPSRCYYSTVCMSKQSSRNRHTL